MKISRVLIANRGEIAVRIIKSLRENNIESVVVVSDVDKNSMAAKLADYVYEIGGQSAAESYLVVDKIIEACKHYEVDAVHPGYGFLSEKLELLEECSKNNIKFIGPKKEAIEVMGDKILSKSKMAAVGVPTIPGFIIESKDLLDPEELLQKVAVIKYPVMIKASAGGGGKGMRRVDSEDSFIESCMSCQREAMSSFSDDRIFVEKFIENPRHIEFQVFGDDFGNIEHINERDCSIQRRNQKVIEECPSPRFSEDLRAEMGNMAIKCAKSVDYVNAGTVEFIVSEKNEFFFLEMNTRLQVEHPVTEMTHKVDLVKEQILVAGGFELSFCAEDKVIKGHSIECRVYAEEPLNNYAPSAGKLLRCTFPQESENVRIDTGVRSLDEISIYYDPMICKIITTGNTRKDAIAYMINAIKDTTIFGVETNLSFLLDILTEDKFIAGEYNTKYLEDTDIVARNKKTNSFNKEVLEALVNFDLELTHHQGVDPFVGQEI
ncbi:MAG: ATP-grasp domain-containing protein [Candidatus Cloacimonetes bacterium]|nr:ATP-grasp domain-containing protein [Candidatus Cloacimonadota bacterium]